MRGEVRRPSSLHHWCLLSAHKLTADSRTAARASRVPASGDGSDAAGAEWPLEHAAARAGIRGKYRACRSRQAAQPTGRSRPIADTRRSPAAASYGVIPGTLHSCQTTSARSFGERCYERRLAAEDGSGIHYGTDQRASTRRELIRFRIWGRAGQRRLDRVAVVGVQLWCNLDGELSGPPPDRSLLITGQDGPERILLAHTRKFR
jgi:hypothetical protein